MRIIAPPKEPNKDLTGQSISIIDLWFNMGLLTKEEHVHYKSIWGNKK